MECKREILSFFAHPHVILNLFYVDFSVEYKSILIQQKFIRPLCQALK